MAVTLYIMRHGDAEPAQALKADAIRPLSSMGESEVLASAKWLNGYLRKQGAIGLDWLTVSPFIRAQQTATIVESAVQVAARDITEDAIPESDPQEFCDWMFAMLQTHYNNAQNMMLVSHMPFVSYLVATLDQDTPPLLFPTAGMAEMRLDVEMRRAQFVRMITLE